MAWLYLLLTRPPRSWCCHFSVILLTRLFILLTWSLCYSIFCSLHTLVYTHSCISSCIINSWFCLYVSLFVSIGSIKEFGQVLTFHFFFPEPRSRIFQFTIISTLVVRVSIMGLLYIILFLFLVTSIIIWIPCCCYCGLISLKCV